MSASIVPKRIFEADPVKFRTNPIGSGAFIFEAKVPGQSITYKRNPNYWKSPKPWVDGFSTNYVPDDNARMLQVTSGIADIGYSVPYALVDQYKNFTGTRLQLEPYTNLISLPRTSAMHPLDETQRPIGAELRDSREAINQAVFKNAPRLANSTIGQLQYWDPTHALDPIRLEKGKVIHGPVVCAHGLSTSLLIVGTDTDSIAVATILQSAWSQIGIQLKIRMSTSTRCSPGSSRPTQRRTTRSASSSPDYASSDVGASDELAQFFYEPLAVDFGGLLLQRPHATALVERRSIPSTQAIRRKISWRCRSTA